jgi:hypothetical protein
MGDSQTTSGIGVSHAEVRARGRRAPAAPTAWSASIVRLAPLWVPSFFLLLNLAGVRYYLLPISARVRDPLHAWLKPSGLVGQSAGVVAFVLFLFMYLYPLRKRVRFLSPVGSLPRWLEVHIVAGLSIPIVGAMHAGWRFQGLIGVGYLAMLAVSLSGIVGRYLYVHIPRRRSGAEMTLDEIAAQRRALAERIGRAIREEPARVESVLGSSVRQSRPRGSLSSVWELVAGDMAGRRTARILRRQWQARGLDRETTHEVVRLVRRHLAITQQLRMLDVTQRLFRLWHVVHRPFSVTAFVAVAIHVVVAVSLGVTWFW